MLNESTHGRMLVFGLVLGIVLVLSPYFLSRYDVYFLALILVTGLLATSLNLVLGFGGMYQFHHAVFYGVGAYSVALIITKTDLPAFVGFIAGPIVAAILAVIMGLICVRLSKLYFGMLQLSLGSLVWALVFRWYSFTGGDDGIHGIPLPSIISTDNGSYYLTLAVTLVCMALMYIILNSPFGRVFQAIRDNPERSESIGINVHLHQLVGQAVAGFFAGVAGVLFVAVEKSVFPDLLFWSRSLEILIMCLLGGWFTFLGPMLGAAIIVSLRIVLSAHTEYWTSILAVILMLLIYFLPEGVLGYFQEIAKRRQTSRQTGA
ncbi:branched-chain amino acid ABC transporter permease [Desulfomonile tiedjei]|uniref:Amino acid/amide ABC transporter membrane protein 2, HAAT family n=1 Tax=Desulfomonile tiedjei (strain ATCC 49306 / DSM 6799 / DCB-1) TaxID=706587 RepID=I4CBC7_DESTA|nr:branched-chain amino acid ABC transporter permease [Desulfomonile tiedjei]AFM26868.1 amino acid/amide ABC transporter membrane protein 2, HAAT family [Desulfomonile tiedjei DSM 6799]